MSISLRIKQTIERSGLSQREFALKAGVGESQVSRWISGETVPGVPSLQKIATVGKVDFDWLASGRTYSEPAIPATTVPEQNIAPTGDGDEIEKKLRLIEESVRYASALRVEGLLDDQTRLNIVSKSEALIKQIDELLSRDRSA